MKNLITIGKIFSGGNRIKNHRLYGQTLIRIFSFICLLVILSTCTKDDEPENRDFDPTISIESIVNINTSEIGGSGLKLISSRDDDSPISKESFNTVVSKEGEQLLVVADANDELRALTLSTPSTSKSDIIQLGARSTAITLVFISPGILSIDEQEATTVINNIVNLTSFNPFKTYLKSNLILKSLNDLVGTTLFDSLLIDCVEEYYQKFKVVTKGIDKGGYENMFSLNLGSNNKLELKNYSFRYVNVVKRDLNTASAELNVANVLPQMKGAVPLSWGSLFTLSTADPSIESIDYTPFANSSISEFWVAGPGFKKLQDNPPQSIKNIEQPYVETIVYYVIFPVLDLWTGAKNLLQTSTPKFKELMLQIKTVRSLYFTSTANNFISFARETSNFTITVLGAIAATSTAPIAAVAVKVLAISSVIFSSVNLVTFAIDMSQIEPYSKFNIIPPVSLPTVTTNGLIIINNEVGSGSNVTSDGGAPITARGMCWSTSQNPTTANNKTTDGAGVGYFSSSITGLTANTTYYIRAYATNSAGTAYSDQITYTTHQTTTLPTVTTNSISNITQTSASSGGNVTSDGNATVTARGICWSTSQTPTTANNKNTDGTGVGFFTSSITTLAANTTYYVRAYATNSQGTAYGSQLMFTTGQTTTLPTVTTNSITNITQTNATGGGNVTSDGNATVTARGICWSTSQTPTITNNKTTDGTGVGIFTSSITGLIASTTYYVRAYATNSVGTAYGTQVNFTTSSVALVVPTLTTTASSSITSTTATSGGTITSDGGASITAKGVCWSTSANPTTALSTKTTDGTGTGSFASSLTNLSANTTYYVRAYATNSVGTAYGTQVSFTTSALTLVVPTLTTTAASSITSTTATSGGNISSDGGASVTARGVCWSTSANPTTALSTKTTDGTGTGSFASSLTNLSANTTYYVRAYATNSVGTAYGSQVSFSTSSAGNLTGTFTDIRDGHVYKTVIIGTQTWMAENLVYLPTVSPPTAESTTTPYYYVYEYSGTNVSAAKATANYSTYGVLYNYPAAKTGCPSGWHLPSFDEWYTLTTFLGGYSVAGGKLKEAGAIHWQSPNIGATNSTGFTALPGGYRSDYSGGSFFNLGNMITLWTEFNNSSQSWCLESRSNEVLGFGNWDKNYGQSVRCIKD